MHVVPSADPILIWGAGAIGGVLGAFLARAGHPVHLVDIDSAHVKAMNAGGLEIEGPVDSFRQPVTADTPATLRGRFRRVFLAVKAHHTACALEQLLPHLTDDGFVVSAQNGLNERLIAARIGPDRTVGCFLNFGADWLAPGRILLGNRATVAVGELDGARSDRLAELHGLLQVLEPDAVATDDIWGYLWGKVGYGALLFATALTPLSIAEALASPAHRPVYASLGRETMQLAVAEGVSPLGFNGFDPDAFRCGNVTGIDASIEAMVDFNRYSAKSHSGIYRDLAVRRRRTEVDAQLGVLPPIARAHDMALPAVKCLIDLIHEIEAGACGQSLALLDRMLASCS